MWVGNGAMQILTLFVVTTGLLAQDIVKVFRNATGMIKSPDRIQRSTYYNFTIIPFMGSTIKFETEQFNLIPQDKYGDCNDFVRIKQVFSAMIPKISSNEDKRYCGKRKIEKFLTASRITVLFKKESRNNTIADFRIKYEACGGTSTGSNGTVTTHPFRLSNDSKELRCYFSLDTGTTSPILLNIRNSYFRENTNCTSHIQISDGNNSTITLCDSVVTETFFLDKGPVNILYDAKGGVNGMRANYTITSKENFIQHLHGNNGSFSPRVYDGKFVNNAEYVFNITTGSGREKLIMCFTEADLDSKCNDYVVVSSDDTESELVLCKENITSEHIVRKSNSAKVVFKTNFEGSGQGFRGSWSSCGGPLAKPEGVIFPPYSCNRTIPFLGCQYEINATGTDDVFIAYNTWKGVDQNVPSHQSMWSIGQPDQKEDKWIINTNSSVITHYLLSPRIYRERTGSITLHSPLVDVISPGKTCTFIINAGEMDVVHFNVSITTKNSNCSDDFISVDFYPKERTKFEIKDLCDTGIYKNENMKSFGSVNITYVSVNDHQTPFEIHFDVKKVDEPYLDDTLKIGQVTQTSRNFWRKLMSNNLLLPAIASAVGVIIVLAIIVAVIKYRKKKKNSSNDLVWLTDKSTSTLEKSFVPFLPELDKLSLNNEDQRGEIIVGLGGYAEVIFPEKKEKEYKIEPASNLQARKVSTFSLKRTNSLQVDTSIDPNINSDEMRVRNEYSTPWDAKNEKDKIIKVMSLQYQGNSPGPFDPDNQQNSNSEFQYSHTSGTTFGIPCTEGVDCVDS